MSFRISQNVYFTLLCRFGEVEKVKLLPKKTGQGGGVAAFIDFIELRSAQKAHNCPIVIQNREIRMNYNDPKQGRQTTNQPVQNFQRDFERMPEFDEMPRMKDRQMKKLVVSNLLKSGLFRYKWIFNNFTENLRLKNLSPGAELEFYTF